MAPQTAVTRLAALLKRLRHERRVSKLLLADMAAAHASVVHRAERGMDSRLSTWDKLFEGLGYRLLFDVTESSEDAEGLLQDETYRRQENRAARQVLSNTCTRAIMNPWKPKE